MANTITGVLLDAQNALAKRMSIADELSSYYKHLDCTCIDIVSRTIGGKRYAIVCDDEGLLKEDCRISAIDADYQPLLCGSLFVCADGNNGELASLTDADIVHVLKHTRKIPTRRYPDGLCMLTRVGY